jgi:hypothetical protein
LVSEAIERESVQPFFISEEKLARQAYRYDHRYRLAALLLMVALACQLPFLALLFYQNRINEEEASRREFALQKKAQLTAELGNLKETEWQLDQITSWEPVLRARMPVSAVIGAVEETIPRDVVLSRFTLEAANYRSVALTAGSFRVPETYMITMEGERKGPDPEIWGKFLGRFLSRLPPGSAVVTSGVGNEESPKKAIPTCKAVLKAQANGNYFPLGANKIDTEENL